MRRNIFVFPAKFPNGGILARFMRRLYARVEHKRVVGGDGHTAYRQRLILIRWYCGMKRIGPILHVCSHETGSTD